MMFQIFLKSFKLFKKSLLMPLKIIGININITLKCTWRGGGIWKLKTFKILKISLNYINKRFLVKLAIQI